MAATPSPKEFYPLFARQIVSNYLRQQPDATGPELPPSLVRQAGAPGACFVSIKKRSGELRGCIGTIAPTQQTLMHEIAANAIAAAARDTRFAPLGRDELQDIYFSVDILGIPEPVLSPANLDPKKWGVIVTKGNRRGLLLPDLDGVTTVEQQLSIAARKAGLADWHDADLQRFSVTRFQEA